MRHECSPRSNFPGGAETTPHRRPPAAVHEGVLAEPLHPRQLWPRHRQRGPRPGPFRADRVHQVSSSSPQSNPLAHEEIWRRRGRAWEFLSRAAQQLLVLRQLRRSWSWSDWDAPGILPRLGASSSPRRSPRRQVAAAPHRPGGSSRSAWPLRPGSKSGGRKQRRDIAKGFAAQGESLAISLARGPADRLGIDCSDAPAIEPRHAHVIPIVGTMSVLEIARSRKKLARPSGLAFAAVKRAGLPGPARDFLDERLSLFKKNMSWTKRPSTLQEPPTPHQRRPRARRREQQPQRGFRPRRCDES